MPTFTEVLPAQKSSEHNAILWTPATGHGRGKGGFLILHSRVSVAYSVTEYGTSWDGRAFHMTKDEVGGGDKEEESYDVFCGRNRQDCQCSCKGFSYGRGRPCKHVNACRAILDNGWMDVPVNPETDCSSTECPF